MIDPDPPITVPATSTASTTVYAAGASSGVALNPPPADLMVSITDAVKKACATIPDGQRNALVARVDLAGANLVLAHKLADDWKVMEWFGRTWKGDLNAGVQVVKTW